MLGEAVFTHSDSFFLVLLGDNASHFDLFPDETEKFPSFPFFIDHVFFLIVGRDGQRYHVAVLIPIRRNDHSFDHGRFVTWFLHPRSMPFSTPSLGLSPDSENLLFYKHEACQSWELQQETLIS